ncbi:MAG: cytochrome c3 family protein [Armatimonadetes bacterium]|nr:cytochrome c3 family protein [Armatimonadota bacterium]
MRYATRRGALPGAIALVLLPLLSQQAGRAAPQAGGTCEDCHSYMSERSQRAVKEWKDGIHASVGVGCADCHGGDPKATSMDASMSKAAGFIGTPKRSAIPQLCARCHADPVRMRPYNLPTSQYDQYLTSVHGKRLRQGDTRVAVCTDCHGIHDIRRKNDVESSVYKTNIADTCARCHSDAKHMQPYGIPTDQHEQYLRSVHGQKLVKERDLAAPSCADCHGTHGATPPGVTEVSEVCGRCHTLLEQLYSKSPHRAAVQEHGVPRCVDCHQNHEIAMPTDEKLVSKGLGGCGSCHDEQSRQFAVAKELHTAITGVQRDQDRVRAELQRVARLHEDIADGEAALANADTSLKEARANVHSVSVKAIGSQIENARLAVGKARDVASEGFQRSYWRRTNVALAAFVFLSISGLLFVKWGALHRRWRLRLAREEEEE